MTVFDAGNVIDFWPSEELHSWAGQECCGSMECICSVNTLQWRHRHGTRLVRWAAAGSAGDALGAAVVCRRRCHGDPLNLHTTDSQVNSQTYSQSGHQNSLWDKALSVSQRRLSFPPQLLTLSRRVFRFERKFCVFSWETLLCLKMWSAYDKNSTVEVRSGNRVLRCQWERSTRERDLRFRVRGGLLVSWVGYRYGKFNQGTLSFIYFGWLKCSL